MRFALTGVLRSLAIGVVVVVGVAALLVVLRNDEPNAGDTPPDMAEPIAAAAVVVDSIPTSSEGTTEAELPDGPSALRHTNAAEFPPSLVNTDEIISGGPPPDGIPSIDNPNFLDVIDVPDLLEPQEAVIALVVDDDARAYPIRIMTWHEIVNDTVAGVPVTVTYCPLCSSAVTYRREVRGVETTFGTSGRLYSSALVMYDRATESLWTHFDGRAVVGVLTGDQLEVIGSPLLSWDEFRLTYPTGKVLDPDATGHQRDYGTNPYVGYDDAETFPFLYTGTVDDRARAKERVVGFSVGGMDTAYALTSLMDSGPTVTNVDEGETPLVIFWKPGLATSLDSVTIADGRDIGSVGVFVSTVDGRSHTFYATEDEFVDRETGSRWNILGKATAGQLAGTTLKRVPHLDTFWFAWATYRPGSALVGELSRDG